MGTEVSVYMAATSGERGRDVRAERPVPKHRAKLKRLSRLDDHFVPSLDELHFLLQRFLAYDTTVEVEFFICVPLRTNQLR